MKKLMAGVVALFILSSLSMASEETDDLVNLLIAAKATGMCGTFKQMSAFQESTQMPGGDEFLVRFLNTEAARLGKTLLQFLEECQVATKVYVEAMTELGYTDYGRSQSP